MHRPILLVNSNLYYVLINILRRLPILALYVVVALTSFVGGNAIGNVSLAVYGGVAESLKDITVAVVVKYLVLQQLPLTLLFRVVVNTARFSQRRFYLLVLLLPDLFRQVGHELPRRCPVNRVLVTNIAIAAVFDRNSALELLLSLELDSPRLSGCHHTHTRSYLEI